MVGILSLGFSLNGNGIFSGMFIVMGVYLFMIMVTNGMWTVMVFVIYIVEDLVVFMLVYGMFRFFI